MLRTAKFREPNVVPRTWRLGSWADSLAEKYSKVAEESGTSSKAREAAALISVVEGHMGTECADEAAKSAKEAAALFKEAGDATGSADAQRMLAHALTCTGKASEALELAKGELEAYRGTGNKLGQAKMLLSVAEAQGDIETKDTVEAALASASEAITLFKAEDDKKMTAVSQLLVASLTLEKKGEVKRKADEAKKILEEVVPIFRDIGNTKGEAYAVHVGACARALGGAPESAMRAVKEALSLYQKLQMQKQEAFELLSIARFCLAEGEIEEASDAAEESLGIFGDDLKASEAEAAAMQTLVYTYIQEKEPKDALDLAKGELERFQEAGNSRGVAAAEEMMMMAYMALGNEERGMRLAQRASETLKEMGDTKGQARMLRTMCTLYRAKGEHDKALAAAQDALSIFEEMDDAKEQAITLQYRADVYMEKKEHGRAIALASEARELYQETQELEGEASALLQLSTAQLAEGDNKKAAASAKEAQDKAGEVQDTAGEADALRTLVNVQVADKDYDQCLKSLSSLLALAKELGQREDEVSTMVLTCHVILKQFVEKQEEGKFNEKLHKSTSDKATKMAKDSLSIARKLDAPGALGSALFAVAQAQIMNGKLPEATKAAEEALGIFQSTGFAQGEAAVLILLADIQSYNQEFGKARETAEEGVYLFQSIGDVEGEDQGWSQLERIEKLEAELREQQLQAQQQLQMQQAQAWMAQGQNLQPLPQQTYEEAAPSAAAGGAGYEAKIVKLDIGSGLDPTMLKGQILEITKGLIGFDEEIEFDAPLMESGLTSNTAVLLRDALTQTLPGVNLPVTLVFDYPSIQSMSELIVENAAKAAKKAAKAALKG